MAAFGAGPLAANNGFSFQGHEGAPPGKGGNKLSAAAAAAGAKAPQSFGGQTRANALDPAQLDPKRAKRIIANRQSAHRSRMKKLQAIHGLEEQVTQARLETRTVAQQAVALHAKRSELRAAAASARAALLLQHQEAAQLAAVQQALLAELSALGVTAAPTPPSPVMSRAVSRQSSGVGAAAAASAVAAAAAAAAPHPAQPPAAPAAASRLLQRRVSNSGAGSAPTQLQLPGQSILTQPLPTLPSPKRQASFDPGHAPLASPSRRQSLQGQSILDQPPMTVLPSPHAQLSPFERACSGSLPVTFDHPSPVPPGLNPSPRAFRRSTGGNCMGNLLSPSGVAPVPWQTPPTPRVSSSGMAAAAAEDMSLLASLSALSPHHLPPGMALSPQRPLHGMGLSPQQLPLGMSLSPQPQQLAPGVALSPRQRQPSLDGRDSSNNSGGLGMTASLATISDVSSGMNLNVGMAAAAHRQSFGGAGGSMGGGGASAAAPPQHQRQVSSPQDQLSNGLAVAQRSLSGHQRSGSAGGAPQPAPSAAPPDLFGLMMMTPSSFFPQSLPPSLQQHPMQLQQQQHSGSALSAAAASPPSNMGGGAMAMAGHTPGSGSGSDPHHHHHQPAFRRPLEPPPDILQGMAQHSSAAPPTHMLHLYPPSAPYGQVRPTPPSQQPPLHHRPLTAGSGGGAQPQAQLSSGQRDLHPVLAALAEAAAAKAMDSSATQSAPHNRLFMQQHPRHGPASPSVASPASAASHPAGLAGGAFGMQMHNVGLPPAMLPRHGQERPGSQGGASALPFAFADVKVCAEDPMDIAHVQGGQQQQGLGFLPSAAGSGGACRAAAMVVDEADMFLDLPLGAEEDPDLATIKVEPEDALLLDML